MKIGIDASRYADEKATGVEWYSWHIINSLLKIIPKSDDVVLYSREAIEGQPYKILKAKRFWTLGALSKEMRKNPPDVLFVPSHTLPLSLPKRAVVTIHDLAFKHLKKSYSWKEFAYLNWSTGFAVKHAAKIIVPSRATKDDLIHFYSCPAEKIAVIPHGFTPPQAAHDDVLIAPDSKYALFVGRLESKKNLVRLIEAFAEFAKSHDDFRLVLAGKRGVGFNKILKKANELSLMDKIFMPGYVTEEEKTALYKHCQFFVFPSLYEGFGLPILEAFFHEKPVLCSKISSLPEVAGEAAKYVDPESVKSILDGLETLAKMDDYARELAAKGRERLKEFSWEKAARETLKILHG